MRIRTVLPILLLIAVGPARAWVPMPIASPIELPEQRVAPAPAALHAAFESRVPGGWTLDWDTERGTLQAGRRGRIPAASVQRKLATQAAAITAASQFRAAAGAWLGDPGATLQPVRCAQWGRAWHVTWQQYAGARPVLDAYLDLTLVAETGAVVAFRNTLGTSGAVGRAVLDAQDATTRVERHVARALFRTGAAEVAVAIGTALRPAWHLTLAGARADERWDAVVAADDGSLLRLDSLVRPLVGTCTVDVPAAYHDDIPAPRPAPWLRVALLEDGATQETVTTDGQGVYRFVREAAATQTLEAGLDGLYVSVSNAVGEPRTRAAGAVATSADLHFGAASGRLDERTIYVHTNLIHDYARAAFDFRLLDFPMPAVAGEAQYANAYWNGEGMHFGDGGMTFYNLGLFADVIYHEYTHGITDYMYRPLGGLSGGQGSALHEGLSDYFACTITGESQLGEGLFRNAPDTPLRELDHRLQWPGDARGESHADGEIFAGALWDLRRSVGAAVADPLIHFARTLAPRTFEAYANAILLQDDLQFGDGQAANGSPHRVHILTAFAAHGIGEAAGPGRQLVHAPLGDTEAVGESRTILAGFEGHASGINDSLVLEYSLGGNFTARGMQRQADGDFAVTLPGTDLGDGVVVRYWIRTVARRGIPAQVLPPGAPAVTYTFRVGTDTAPPTVIHEALGRAAAIAWPATLAARIDDNLGIAAAWVETWQDGAPSARLGLVRDVLDPTAWRARFANVGSVGTVFDYRIVAQDASRAGLVTCVPSCDGSYRFTLAADLSEDFETGSGGFTHQVIRAGRSDAWRLGPRLDGSAGSAWICAGDDAGSEYEPGIAAALVSPTLQIGTGARAQVRSWIDAEPNAAIEAFDGGTVEIEIDGDGIWRSLVPQGGYTHVVAETGGANVLVAGTPCFSGRDATWRALEFDLGAWSGRRVRLRFVFAADTTPSAFGYRGWALDDFSVDPGSENPTDAAATPLPLQLSAQPFANPGRGWVGLAVAVPAGAGRTRVGIYDARGRWVRDLWRGLPAPGVHRLEWHGDDARGVARAAGVYYYRVDSARGGARGKFILLR